MDAWAHAERSDLSVSTITDVDAHALYHYYSRGGTPTALASTAANAFSVASTVGWMFVALACVNWGEFGQGVWKSPITACNSSCVFGWVILVVGLASLVYIVWNLRLKELLRLHTQLSDVDVKTLTWVEFCNIAHSRSIQLSHPESHLPLQTDVTARVCRVRDVMQTLHEQGVIDDVFGWVPRSQFAEYALTAVLVGPRLDPTAVAPTWRHADVSGLHKGAVCMAVQTLLLAPVVTCFVGIKAIGRINLEYRSAGSTGSRLVTVRGASEVRGFMELEHELNYRTQKLAAAAAQVCSREGTPWMAMLAYALTLPLMLLLVVGFLDEPVMTEQELFGQTLLWWTAALAVTVGTLRSNSGSWAGYWSFTSERAPVRDSQDLARIARFWRDCSGLKRLKRIAGNQILVQIKNVVGTMLTPIVMVRLFRRAAYIVPRLNRCMTYVNGIGSMSIYSTLDEEKVLMHGSPVTLKLTQSAEAFKTKQLDPRFDDLTASMSVSYI